MPGSTLVSPTAIVMGPTPEQQQGDIMSTRFVAASVASLVLIASSSAQAQWLSHRTPSLPRTPDGQVNLGVQAPRTADGKPDLSGMWGWQPGAALFSLALASDLKPEEVRPWALELARQRGEDLGKDDPNFRCLPQGPRLNLFAPIPVKFVQTPTLLLILSEELTYRQVFLDGRSLPVDPEPSFMGYSVGHWDGDTLVVESFGFKDRTWLDFAGLPHSEALRITERIRRSSVGHLEIVETIDDREAFTRPFTVTLGAQFIPDTELLELVCAENEKSAQHIVGKASELLTEQASRAVKVSPAVLAKYVGTYDFRFPENPTTPILMSVRLDGDTLFLGAVPLIPLTETTFGGPLRIEFVVDANGTPTHFLSRWVEGDLKAVRLQE
jgi:hypothetical protein